MKEQFGEKVTPFFYLLRVLGNFIPGDRFKTAIYLNCIGKPRRILRKAIGGFYRIEIIYEVLKEFNRFYEGKFSILEFGVADGYSFTKQLYATRYLKMEDRVIVHGFDTFEGLPEISTNADRSLITGSDWVAGQYRGRYEELLAYCQEKYKNFRLHKGLFENSLTEEFLASLREYLPILIWVDCDYYSSTKTVLEKLIPYTPTGCVFYFDDLYYNFSSRFTGEMRAVWEVNQGMFGDDVELVLDRELSLDSNRVYRFINVKASVRYKNKIPHSQASDPVRHRHGDSPFP